MRIINLKQLLSLKGEALIQKYAPQYREGFEIYVGPCGTMDFVTVDLDSIENSGDMDLSYQFDDAESDPSVDLKLDLEFYGRDGCFEENQLFAVYTKKDLDDIISRLQTVRDNLDDGLK